MNFHLSLLSLANINFDSDSISLSSLIRLEARCIAFIYRNIIKFHSLYDFLTVSFFSFVCLFADVAIKVLDLRAGGSDIIGASKEGRGLFLHE